MDFYFVLCIALAILVTFSVFDFVLKENHISKVVAILFLLTSSVFSLMDNIDIFSFSVSLNIILFFAVAIFYFATLKSVRNYSQCILVALVVLGVLTTYSTFNFLSFEYAYVQPIIFFGVIAAIICFFVCKNFKSVFAGAFIGAVVYEFVLFEISLQTSNFVLGSQLVVSFLLCCVLCFAFFHSVGLVIAQSHQKKQANIY